VLDRPRSVYVRSLHCEPLAPGELAAAMERDWRKTTAMLRERGAQLASALLRWEALGVPVYNGLQSQVNLTKPYQLALLEAAGLPVPATLWTNDAHSVLEFAAQRPLVYKPTTGGALTQRVTAEDLRPERLVRLGAAPVCFQELLPGRDLRVYVLDGEVLCALAIASEAVDFRGSETGVVPVELPDALLRECVRAAQLLGLRFTGMDLKEDGCGRPRFLELNSSPMFLGFEAHSGAQISAPLCARLAAGAADAAPRARTRSAA
jgi:glutathione synthase/RimK-type ligase-like ATP-grasp enzyme